MTNIHTRPMPSLLLSLVAATSLALMGLALPSLGDGNTASSGRGERLQGDPMSLNESVCSPGARSENNCASPTIADATSVSVATFAGGCFWCVESAFDDLPGVISAVSGYTGGQEKDPSCQEVSSGRTGHVEAVQIRYDPDVISYAQLLDVFWRQIDPTDDGGQFADRGSQYRTAIFVHDDKQRKIAQQSIEALEKQPDFSRGVATKVLAATAFYAAEGYHQDYHKKNPVRYKAYRRGSGRESYIQKFWKGRPSVTANGKSSQLPKFRKPDPETLKKKLNPLQYDVTQKGATERPFSNDYHDNHRVGLYVDVVSGEPLFSSADKFDSGSGWPSFTRPLSGIDIVEKTDGALGMQRVEVRSPIADSHLGHVFDDGPAPTGQRYCINSASLRFVPVEDMQQQGYGDYLQLFEHRDN